MFKLIFPLIILFAFNANAQVTCITMDSIAWEKEKRANPPEYIQKFNIKRKGDKVVLCPIEIKQTGGGEPSRGDLENFAWDNLPIKTPDGDEIKRRSEEYWNDHPPIPTQPNGGPPISSGN